ncbi:TPA: alpha/beta fold hydrolase [Streptococcus mutans]|uniref:alpha/beta fold hydrolase n=1 Tax=Streptococcus mutans TaxID=1309 RepID=UPI000466DEE1|nr:alpha/beta fold hydrolase [Streptococcus mutans]MCB5112905.1 alpha/beta fold hydrolase [Streptococcus mutans]MCB5139418.1 alpha/beta fold hydrolase [Streptococcus mutans]NLQ71075.1 alpha/beta fold hydrolase [Streptococcus mutans]
MFKDRYKFSLIVSNEDYIVRDHRLHGVCAVPGVTFLDVIIRFAKMKGFNPANVEVRKLLFLQPIVTSEEYDKKVFINLERGDHQDYWEFTIKSQKYKDGKIIDEKIFNNAKGEMHLCKDGLSNKININSLKAQAEKVYDMDDAYAFSRKGELFHYKFMKLLGNVYVSKDYLLGELHLSKLAEKYLDNFYLHPAYLDGCLSVTSILVSEHPEIQSEEAKPFIPIFVDSFKASARFKKKIYVYVKMNEISVAHSKDIMYINLEIYDENGKQLAFYNRFAAKRVRNDNIKKLRDEVPFEQGEKSSKQINSSQKQEGVFKLRGYIENELRQFIALTINKLPNEVDINANFYNLGMDSTQLMQIVNKLENKHNIVLYPTLLFEYPSIYKLAKYLEAEYKETYQNIYSNVQMRSEENSEKVKVYGTDKNEVVRELLRIIGPYCNMDIKESDINKGFYDIGLDSSVLLELSKNIEMIFNIAMYPTIMFEYNTISKLADYLKNQNIEIVKVKTKEKIKKKNTAIESSTETIKKTNIDFCYRTEWEENPIVEQKVKTSPNILIIYTKESTQLVEVFCQYYNNKVIQKIELESEDNVEESLKKYNISLDIYYIAVAQLNVHDQDELDEINRSEDQGVLTLFRLIKEISVLNKQLRVNSIKIITNNIFKITKNENVSPNYSAILGFYKSMMKEYPNISMNYFDIDLAEIRLGYSHIVNNIIKPIEHNQTDGKGNEVAIRKGKQYVKKLKYVNLPKIEKNPFREKGTYVILGGAGGIGTELAKYISKNSHGNIALIGRREYNQSIEEKIKAINSLGGRAIYLQADITEEAQFVKTVKEINDIFGEIHGAIHSAIVLQDHTIATMQEEDLKAVLAPKVQGSVIFYHAMKNQPLDFMLFFSSTQSYIGNIGQANYAAACTFKDSYAQYIENREDFKVHVINWGYWGSVGIVSTKEYNEQLKKVGSKSIEPLEGMEIIVRVLGNNVNNVIAMKVEDYILDGIGITKKEKDKLYPVSIPSVENDIISDTIKEVEDFKIIADEKSFEEFIKFGRMLLLSKFQKMGVFVKKEEIWSYTELKYRLGIVSKYEKMLHALLNIMKLAGFIQIKDDKIQVTDKIENEDTLTYISNVEKIKDKLMYRYPDIADHINLIWVCVNAYDKVLSGKENYLSVMFPKGSMKLVEKIYGGNELTNYFNRLVAKTLKFYLVHRLATESDGYVNILELGAGTGGTSKFVLKEIEQYAKNIMYMYTDKSIQFCLESQQHFSSQYPFVKFNSLDIEKNPLKQGYKEGGYDFIFASNVLHATKSIITTVVNAKKLLKKRGILVINETTEFQDFTTLTFGITDGWWRFEDGKLRISDSPLLSLESWEKVLIEAGFVNVKYIGLPSKEERKSGQHVIIAESNGYNRYKPINVIQSEDDNSDENKETWIELINVYQNSEDERFTYFWKNYKDNKYNSLKTERIQFRKKYRNLNKNEIMHMLVDIEENTKIEVVVAGKGKPILLISGFGFSAFQWKEQFNYLSEEYMLININYPGMGLSDSISDFTYEGISKVFIEVLNLLGIQSEISVVGSSWGGIIAQTIAKEYSDKVKKLILVGAFSEYMQSRENSLRDSLKKDFTNIGEIERYEKLQLNQYMDMDISTKYNIFSKNNFSTENISPYVTVPTTMIKGTEDLVVSKENSQRLLELLPNAELFNIKNAGHLPNYTNFEEFNDFLKKIC